MHGDFHLDLVLALPTNRWIGSDTCQWHCLRDKHDIIEKRTINIKGHMYAPFFLLHETVQLAIDDRVLILNSAADPFMLEAAQRLSAGELILAEDNLASLQQFNKLVGTDVSPMNTPVGADVSRPSPMYRPPMLHANPPELNCECDTFPFMSIPYVKRLRLSMLQS